MGRICNKCGEDKALEQFEKAVRYRGGRMPVCRECRAEQRRLLHEKPKVDPGPDKTCAKCGEIKLLIEFCRDKRSPDGYAARCLACRRVSRAEDPLAQRRRMLRWKYDISLEDYEAFLLGQGGVCSACDSPPRGARAMLDIDHDHATGAVRGLLCSPCNTSLGLLLEDPARLRGLLRYIERRPVAV